MICPTWRCNQSNFTRVAGLIGATFFLALGCNRDPSTLGPTASADRAESSAARKADSVASSNPTASPDGRRIWNPSWTLAFRKPSALAELEARGKVFVSTVVKSELFEEGPLYLERRGSRLQGILDRTIVEGTVNEGGTLELRDSVTQRVVFRGTAKSAKEVTGTVFAENEERTVQSVADLPELFPGGVLVFNILRTSSRAVSEAKLNRHLSHVSGQVNGYGWLNHAPFVRKASGTLDNQWLHLTVGSEKWTLREGPGLFVGRVEPGGDVVVLSDPHVFEKAFEAAPRSVALGGGLSVVSHAVKHKNGACEVSLDIPVITGPQTSPELNRLLAEQMVRWAMGPLVPDEGLPVPTPEKLRCSPGANIKDGPEFMGATYEASALGGGWLNLRLKGYARTGGARATVGHDCVLIDSARGRLYEGAELLNDAQRATVTGWVERQLRMTARNARLDLDDENYYTNAAPVSEQTALCLSTTGLEVAFNPGEVTRYTPTPGPSAFIPRELLARLAIEGSVLAGWLKSP